MTRLEYALGMLAGGVSLVPIRLDGGKRPAIRWKGYQTRAPKPWEVRSWVRTRGWGIAVVGGAISGNLEILDFDAMNYFEYWSNLVNAYCPGVIDTLPLIQTPSQGYHLYYRCAEITGNQKLAQEAMYSMPERRYIPGKTLIETRGEGGYAVTPASPGACHPSGKRYRIIHGSLWEIPPISLEQRHEFLRGARAFNQYVEPLKPPFTPRTVNIGERPGDVFAATHSWEQILEPHGWKAVGRHAGITDWRRPGKEGRGQSATTGYHGRDVFYVFSTNALPFDHNQGYDKFHVWVILNFSGDYRAAAKSLTEEKTRDRTAAKVQG